MKPEQEAIPYPAITILIEFQSIMTRKDCGFSGTAESKALFFKGNTHPKEEKF